MHGHLFSCPLIHVFKFISGPLERGSGISNEGYTPSIYSFDEVTAGEFCLKLFSSSPEIFFLNLVFHFHLFDGVSLQDTQVFVGFVFSERSRFVVIWLLHSVSHLSLATFHDEHGTFFYAKFHSYALTLYSNSEYERFQLFFLFFANNLMSSMYIRWVISCDLVCLYPAMHFLCMWLSGIMAIMNSKGDIASPWKIPLWIFVSANLLPPAVSSTLQFCMVFSMKFMTWCDILYILRLYIIQVCGTLSYTFL